MTATKYEIVKRTIEPISARHWAGGDTIIEEQMQAGGYRYWTVVEMLPPSRRCREGSQCAALGGRRYKSQAEAQRALSASRGESPQVPGAEEHTYLVTWRLGPDTDPAVREYLMEVEEGSLEDVVEICEEHGVAAVLRDDTGSTRGHVASDGNYVLS